MLPLLIIPNQVDNISHKDITWEQRKFQDVIEVAYQGSVNPLNRILGVLLFSILFSS